MKQMLYIPAIALLFAVSCTEAKQEQVVRNYNYKEKMKKTYFANYDFSGHFNIIFNGVSMVRNRKDGVISGIEYLNPYISKSGVQNIMLVVKPLNPNSKILPKDVKDYFIDIVYTENGAAAPVKNVKRCTFPAIDKPVDSLVYTWTFDADVPYELEGFTNSLSLTKEDPAKLLSEVFEYYQNVHKIINEGNYRDYLQLYKKSREREMISVYMDEKKQKDYLESLEKRISSSKGYMQPLTDYKLFIHPNGKLVGLITSGGVTPLYSKDQEGKRKQYGLELHRVKGSNKLEVY
ncbi:hypothetical protein G6M26_06965 [Agrobacterium tumefaciens]|nr:hypothetical protein [Agrobacterium tumefaciens]NTE18259.1 hypothetical protein [Agrobacterium tumefaciens]